MINQNTPAFQIVDDIVKSTDSSYAYISSTKTGVFFNDIGFMEAIEERLKDNMNRKGDSRAVP